MAVEVALEDDLFFADLNRQISLLIDEQDDDDYTAAHFTSASTQAYAGSIIHHHPPVMPSQYLYQESFTRQMCKGTGVFIPQSSQPRRKYKQGKRSSPSYAAKYNKNNKQLLNSRSTTNSVGAHANLPPAYATKDINRY